MTNPLLARFIPEARELLQVSASGLLKLERNPTDETAINEVFRAVHTIKGSSGLFDAMALTRLVHAAEDLLGEVRSDALQIDSALVDMLLDSLDQVGQWIDEHGKLVGRHLDEAELGPEGGLANELGVDRDELGLREGLAGVRQGGGRDDRLHSSL